MEQKIHIKATAPNTGDSFAIVSVWQVGNELRVLLESKYLGGAGEAMVEREQVLYVDTTVDLVDFELPVKCYFVNDPGRRIFNSHKEISVYPHESNPFEFLLSPHHFNELVKGGKCLFKRNPPAFDFGALLKEGDEDILKLQDHNSPVSADAIIAHVLQQNPVQKEIVDGLIAASIFSGDESDVRYSVGHFLLGMQKLSAEDQQKMLRLYRHLLNSDNGQCALTGYAHDVITDDVFGISPYNPCSLNEYLRLIEDLQPVTRKMLSTIIMYPLDCIILHEDVAKFDPSFQCERHFYETCDNVETGGNFARAFRRKGKHVFDENDDYVFIPEGRLEDPVYLWMTSALFTEIVDNIENYDPLIRGFSILHRYNMLESHKAQFLTNIRATSALDYLDSLGVLEQDDIEPALRNTEFPAVIKLFHEVNLLGQWAYGVDKAEVGKMLQTILRHPMLTEAFCLASQVYALAKNDLYKTFNNGVPGSVFREFQQVFVNSFKGTIASVNPALRNSLNAPPTLEKIIENMRAKLNEHEVKEVSALK